MEEENKKDAVAETSVPAQEAPPVEAAEGPAAPAEEGAAIDPAAQEPAEGHAAQGEEKGFLADNVRSLSPMQLVLKRFFRSKLSLIGLATIVALFLFCWLGPLFSPYGEETIDYDANGRLNVTVTEIKIPLTDENGDYVYDEDGNQVTVSVWRVQKSEMLVDTLANPSAEHWFGTDKNGYDVLTRIMYGGRVSLTLSLIVVLLETVFGVILGGLAGYFGKWVDSLIMRIVDIFNCIPTLPLLLIIGSVLEGAGVDPNDRIYFMMVFLTLFGWTGIARIVRGQILSLREQEFMVSATARGLSTARKIFRHLVPNVMPQLIVSMTLGLGSVILMEASLSYLGMGVPLTKASWGGMINDVKDPAVLQNYLNLWVPPGICIVLAVLGFNFIGDGLRDAFDPKAKR